MTIGALVALTSLNLTNILVGEYNVVARTWTISGATAATPIVVTSTGHGVPLGRVVHGIVSGVVGMTEANGTWILTPLDANTFSLTTLSAQGIPANSVGENAYVSGGQIQTAFPDYSILLGRRNLQLATGAASPRIVFIPTVGRAWGMEPYGGANPNILPAVYPNVRGSLEQQAMTLSPQLATEFPTFEVWVHGCAMDYGASAPSPDYADFDACQALVFALYSVLFDEVGGLPRAKVLREDWPSQKLDSGSMTQRGQMWMGVIEFQQGVTKFPAQFAPIGVSSQFTVEPVNPAVGDPITIIIPKPPGIASVDFTKATTSGGIFTDPPDWLTISCPTTGRSVQTSASSLVTGLGANAWRAHNVGGATGLGVENASENQYPTGQWTGSGWTAGVMTLTPGEPDPAGGSQAALFVSTGLDYGPFVEASVAGLVCSVWVMYGGSGTGNVGQWLFRDTPDAVYAFVSEATTSWARLDLSIGSAEASLWGYFENRADVEGAPGAGPGSFYAVFPQAETAAYPSSYVGGGNARAADVLSTTTPVAPSGLLLMTMVLAPNFADSEQGVDAPLLWFGSANQVLLQQASSKVAVMVADTIVLTSAALTWSRNQAITVTVSLDSTGALALTVSGATTGNGVTNASGVSPFTVGGTTYLLGTDDGAAESIDLQTVSFTTP
jgi:hypothetical protein